MELILTDSIRLQDKSAAFTAAIAGHEDNVNIVYKFVIAKVDEIEAA